MGWRTQPIVTFVTRAISVKKKANFDSLLFKYSFFPIEYGIVLIRHHFKYSIILNMASFKHSII
jgi:hypothetical protein